MSNLDSKKKMEEFDEDIYKLCSPNNMPSINQLEDLTEDEQNEVELALKLSKDA